MKEIIDEFLWTKENKIITRDVHHVPGLANFSHWNFRNATAPADVHFHSNIYELHCMVHGRRVFQAEIDGALQTCIVTGNQIAVTFPGQPHGYADSFVEPYEFFSLQLDISDPDHLLGLDREYSHSLYRSLQDMQKKLSGKKEQRLTMGSTHVQLLRTAFTFFSDFHPDAVRAGVQFLCCFLFSLPYLAPVQENTSIDPAIGQAMTYIEEHFQENPPLQMMADAAGYSLSYFKAKFKKETGMTPMGYLNTLRMEKAKFLLETSSQSITQISADLSYSSPSHFCMAFRRHTSYSPREYREKHP